MADKLIEWDLPLAEISEQSAREKNIRHGHPSTLHIWWARRPLASSRATTFAALIDDPKDEEKRAELRRLIEQITPWDAVKDGNSPAIEKARKLVLEQFDGEPPKVLDPFAGGGSIPLEALRLGCETYASDYNPVAVFIEKATLEWPQKFGVQVELPAEGEASGELSDLRRGGEKVNLLAYLVEKWANRILEEAREEIGQFYPTESSEGLVGKREITEQEGWIPVGYLWARTIPCQNPTCGVEIPLIRQFWLAKKKNKRVAYRPVVNHETGTLDFELVAGADLKRAEEEGFEPKDGTTSRADAECLICGQVTKKKQVRRLALDGKMGGRLIAVTYHHPCETGKKYRLATEKDREVFDATEESLKDRLDEWPYLDSPLPEEKIPTYELRRLSPPLYGLGRWKDLFNTRQQLALVTFLEKIRASYDRIESECQQLVDQAEGQSTLLEPEQLAKAVMGYLGILLDRMADYLTTIVTWLPTLEAVGHTFTRQAIQMSWDHFEVNPFSGSAGDWKGAVDWVLRNIENNDWHPPVPGTACQASATDLPYPDDHFDEVLTDPPYYDNVPYAALSDFFYAWLKRAVGEQFRELFSTPVVPKDDEIVHDRPHHRSDSHKTKEFFERRLSESFIEIHRVLKPNGVSVIVYAHKTTEGWETMLNALVGAGFVVTGSWPVHTERKARLVAAQTAALASSIYMVCRKRERESLGFWEDIRPRVKVRVEEKLEQFWDAGLIRGGDFFISAIGPGMEAYSEYEEVRTYDDRVFNVMDLLQYIRGVATDFLVHRLLKDASAEAIDKEAQFYLTYRWTFGDNKVEFDDARRIATAEGIDLSALDGSFVNIARKYVHVYGPQDREAIEQVDNMVDAMQRACQLWSKERHEELAEFLEDGGYARRNAFWQFCQAVAECHLNGSKEKQWLEGLLMAQGRYRGGNEAGTSSQADMWDS